MFEKKVAKRETTFKLAFLTKYRFT